MAYSILTVQFDENIISVQYPDGSVVSASGGKAPQQTGTFIVTLKNGYVIDTVLSVNNDEPDELTETTFTYNSLNGDSITITSKIKEKILSYDITKSSKYKTLKAGSHTLQVKAKGNGIDKQDSELSSAVTFEKQALLFNITQTLTNVVEGDSDPNPVTIFENSTILMYYKASDNYVLPETISVSGAEYAWSINDGTKVGTCVLSNATDDVVITIIGEENII